MRQKILNDVLVANVRACWVLRDNLRTSCQHEGGFGDRPVWYAIVLESIDVYSEHRRQGHCRRLIEMLATDLRFDLCIVEGVQNVHLLDALHRWGWECDAGVSDFYHWREGIQRN